VKNWLWFKIFAIGITIGFVNLDCELLLI